MIGRIVFLIAVLSPAVFAQLTLGLVEPIPDAGGAMQVYVQGLQGITTTLEPTEIPRPTSLYGVRVHFAGDVDAPILSIGPVGDGAYTQITFQVPQGAEGTATIIQDQQSVQLPYVRAAWGRLRTADGTLLAQHSVDWRFVTPADPPQPGEWIVTFGYNFGAVQDPPADGVPASANPLSPIAPKDPLLENSDYEYRMTLRTANTEVPLEIGYLGLTPGQFGTYQVNFRMPAVIPAGPAWVRIERIAIGTNLCVTPFCTPAPTLHSDTSLYARLY
ncbi:MAG: hypothetical protein GC160_27275 [Acidobacteria bacterium]|nr:hypothetical protein [Acidobacteriota bacterium]